MIMGQRVDKNPGRFLVEKDKMAKDFFLDDVL